MADGERRGAGPLGWECRIVFSPGVGVKLTFHALPDARNSDFTITACECINEVLSALRATTKQQKREKERMRKGKKKERKNEEKERKKEKRKREKGK